MLHHLVHQFHMLTSTPHKHTTTRTSGKLNKELIAKLQRSLDYIDSPSEVNPNFGTASEESFSTQKSFQADRAVDPMKFSKEIFSRSPRDGDKGVGKPQWNPSASVPRPTHGSSGSVLGSPQGPGMPPSCPHCRQHSTSAPSFYPLFRSDKTEPRRPAAENSEFSEPPLSEGEWNHRMHNRQFPIAAAQASDPVLQRCWGTRPGVPTQNPIVSEQHLPRVQETKR